MDAKGLETMKIGELVFQEEVEPELVDTTFASSKVFSLFQREADRVLTPQLFVRESLVHLWEEVKREFWEKENKKELYVQGSPGCGKTCFFNLWARLLSKKENTRVLIVQFREEGPCHVYIRQPGGKLLCLQNHIPNHEKLYGVVETILEKSNLTFGLCIHDGFRDKVTRRFLSLLNTHVAEENINKVVHVTSLGYSPKTLEGWDSDGEKMQISVDSWSIEEYKAAVECPLFVERTRSGALQQDKDAGVSSWDDIIEEKFFYAGGSARFMFECPLLELQRLLDDTFNDVLRNNEVVFFAKSYITSTTPDAVNTLMQQFGGRAVPVSKYILRKAFMSQRT